MNIDSICKYSIGFDFISPAELNDTGIGSAYTRRYLEVLNSTFPDEHIVEQCAQEGFCLLPQPPDRISLLEIRRLLSKQFPYPHEAPWYEKEEFAHSQRTGEYWLAIKKTIIPHSNRRTWQEQQDMLLANERVPNIAEMAWFILIYGLTRNVHLYQRIAARTISSHLSGHVCVGDCASRGINVTVLNDVDCSSSIGLSVAKDI